MSAKTSFQPGQLITMEDARIVLNAGWIIRQGTVGHLAGRDRLLQLMLDHVGPLFHAARLDDFFERKHGIPSPREIAACTQLVREYEEDGGPTETLYAGAGTIRAVFRSPLARPAS